MKKTLLLLALLAGFSSSCLADALYLAVNNTPYDRQMTRIRPILTSGASGNGVSLGLVNQWMSDLRDIPYGFQKEWKTPSEVATRRPADCKGKAVALLNRMQAQGASNVRLVIGRRAPTSAKTHAWLEWQTKDGNYLLDPTFFYSASPTASFGKRSYVPLYAYAGSKKFRAAGNLVAQN